MTYYVLDTDHLSVLQRRAEPAFGKLTEKLSLHSPDLIFTTIISFQEQIQGWMAFINKAKTAEQLIAAYARLESLLQLFSVSQILSYDQPANEATENLRRQRIRIGTMDLRIAGIVRSQNAILLTRNYGDFSKVPNLRIEDWTI